MKSLYVLPLALSLAVTAQAQVPKEIHSSSVEAPKLVQTLGKKVMHNQRLAYRRARAHDEGSVPPRDFGDDHYRSASLHYFVNGFEPGKPELRVCGDSGSAIYQARNNQTYPQEHCLILKQQGATASLEAYMIGTRNGRPRKLTMETEGIAQATDALRGYACTSKNAACSSVKKLLDRMYEK